MKTLRLVAITSLLTAILISTGVWAGTECAKSWSMDVKAAEHSDMLKSIDIPASGITFTMPTGTKSSQCGTIDGLVANPIVPTLDSELQDNSGVHLSSNDRPSGRTPGKNAASTPRPSTYVGLVMGIALNTGGFMGYIRRRRM